jgi:hypothetical protein
MFRLSAVPVKDEYKVNNGKDVMLGDQRVYLFTECKDTKSGSWEKGFKFGSITYGILKRTTVTAKGKYRYAEYSYNHGVTWHARPEDAKKSKGKVIVERSTPHGEFAFNSIQKINREYHGPGYKWTP